MDAKKFEQKQYRDSLLTKKQIIARAQAGYKRLSESKANRRFHDDWREANRMNSENGCPAPALGTAGQVVTWKTFEVATDGAGQVRPAIITWRKVADGSGWFLAERSAVSIDFVEVR
jgi:hypothetical protein